MLCQVSEAQMMRKAAIDGLALGNTTVTISTSFFNSGDPTCPAQCSISDLKKCHLFLHHINFLFFLVYIKCLKQRCHHFLLIKDRVLTIITLINMLSCILQIYHYLNNLVLCIFQLEGIAMYHVDMTFSSSHDIQNDILIRIRCRC